MGRIVPDGAVARQDGTLELSWACRNPAGAGGVVYQVSRQDGGSSGAFAVIGTTGRRRRFVDATLPRGLAAVTYEVVAIRSTATGMPGRFTVKFGAAGAAAGVASASRLAA